MASTYKTSDFRKGLRVQIDGEPYLMSEMEFKKPGKGNALYICKLKNLIRGTTLSRTYKGGDSLEAADVMEFSVNYSYVRIVDTELHHVGRFQRVAAFVSSRQRRPTDQVFQLANV